MKEEQPKEEWKWIKGYEDRYKVSNKGRIMSLLSDQIMNPNKYGHSLHCTVCLTNKDKKVNNKYWPRLVMEHWGEVYDPSKLKSKKVGIKYKDQNCFNLHPDNLEYDYNQSYNAYKRVEHRSADFAKRLGRKNKYNGSIFHDSTWKEIEKSVDRGFKRFFKKRGLPLPKVSGSYIATPL